MTPRRAQPEAVEQRLFAQRVRLDPRTKNLLWSAWPNGGKRDARTGALMKAEGVNPGPPDLWFFEPAVGLVDGELRQYHGLVIEMKSEAGRLNPNQKAWIEALRARNWRVEVCRSSVAAWDALMAYLAIRTAP